MSKVLNGLSWLVTVQPVATILVLLAVTIILGAGFTRLAPQAPDTVFLPTDSAVATANDEIEMVFGDPAPTVTATIAVPGPAAHAGGPVPDSRRRQRGRIQVRGATARGPGGLSHPAPRHRAGNQRLRGRLTGGY